MKNKKFTFKYKQRSDDSFKRQAESSGGTWDRILKDGFKEFRPKDGDHRIRLMPPTYEGAEHYALPIYVHRNVGPDNQAYLCLSKMKHEPCPVCEEYREAQRSGDKKYADSIRVQERRLAWIIDRNNEKDGPQLYSMAFKKHERLICAVARDPDTGETLWLDRPDDGYDVFFKRETVGDFPEHTGHAPARRPSPLCKDEDTQAEWLQYITDNPLDTVLNYYDYDHIKAAFAGAIERPSREEDDDGPATRNGEHEKARSELHKRIDQRGGKASREEEEDEEEEEEKPARPAKTKSKVRIEEPEDEDADDDESEEDEEEDEHPARSKGSSRRTESDEDDEDDADQRPSASSRSGRRSTVQQAREESDEEDDERAAPSRSSRDRRSDKGSDASAVRGSSSGRANQVREAVRNSRVAEQKEDEEDEDVDEEEEAPRPSKHR